MKVNDQLHAPAALPSGKEPPVPIDRGPQSRSGHSDEKKKKKISQPGA
jgi:hypothetical protein